jgi:hypothetical protein
MTRHQLRLDHLAALVDDVGIIQFSRATAPDPGSGYCVDDAARLAIVAAQLCRIAPLDARPWLRTAQRFLRAALQHDGMHNMLGDDWTWLDVAHHGDHVGRTLWSAGVVLSCGGGVDGESRGHAQALLEDVWSMAMASGSLRTIAYGLLGLTAGAWLPEGARAAVRDTAHRLDAAIDADPRWPWFENRLTYDNARLPQALLAAGRLLGERALIEHALSTLDWYVAQVGLAGPGPLVNIGNAWRGRADVDPHRACGDEQPLEAAALVEALVAAWQATGLAATPASPDGPSPGSTASTRPALPCTTRRAAAATTASPSAASTPTREPNPPSPTIRPSWRWTPLAWPGRGCPPASRSTSRAVST